MASPAPRSDEATRNLPINGNKFASPASAVRSGRVNETWAQWFNPIVSSQCWRMAAELRRAIQRIRVKVPQTAASPTVESSLSHGPVLILSDRCEPKTVATAVINVIYDAVRVVQSSSWDCIRRAFFFSFFLFAFSWTRNIVPDPFFYVTINQLVRYALFSLLKEIKKKKKSERQRERGGGEIPERRWSTDCDIQMMGFFCSTRWLEG